MRRSPGVVACAVALVAAVSAPASARQVGGVGAFGIEAAGGAAGSAVGFTAVRLIAERKDCGEDLSCILGKAGIAVAVSTAGAATGAWVAGRLFETAPSAPGAIVGAVLGAGAAVGVDHLVTEEAGRNLSDAQRLVLFALVQGAVTAIGSRVFAALRR